MVIIIFMAVNLFLYFLNSFDDLLVIIINFWRISFTIYFVFFLSQIFDYSFFLSEIKQHQFLIFDFHHILMAFKS